MFFELTRSHCEDLCERFEILIRNCTEPVEILGYPRGINPCLEDDLDLLELFLMENIFEIDHSSAIT